ncbi:hypothetical protein [uncultured Desulfovibrio sp.]|uniref:hypothetical protein n=1 Tax=uncultured Desulfovibrio sp. TaxID=167968 RepID=UPI0025917440|nr:hypothetical protein [uncultured Desulfovibrio sp.]
MLIKQLPSNFSFWGCAGFEQRSAQIFQYMQSQGISGDRTHIFFNSESESAGSHAFQSDSSQNVNLIPLKYSDPIHSADRFIETLEMDVNSGLFNIVIDITTFTREWLLMLLAIFRIPKFSQCKLTCAYNYAKSMSPTWLSRGPLEMRTVLGYSGSFFSSKKTHLFLILGHEVERAVAIIDSIEPAFLTIATGSKDGSVTEEMHKINVKFKDYIKNCYSIDTREADIDVVDYEKSKSGILKNLKLDGKFNTVIAPLNTKISTVAAGSVCLDNPQIQVCYLPMEQYNTQDFSVPSDKNLFFSLIT